MIRRHWRRPGGSGVRAAAGSASNGELEAQTARAMMARSRRVVVIPDHSKFGRTALNQVLPISAIEIVVTDAVGPSPELDAIRTRGVQVPAV